MAGLSLNPLLANTASAAVGVGAQTFSGATTSASSGLSTGQILGATGGLLSGVGAFMASNAQASAYATSERASKALAVEAPKVAAWKITRSRIIQRKTRSAQANAAYASGVQIEGTPTDVMQLTEQEFLLDQRQIWREGQIEKMSLEEQAKQFAAARKAAKKSGFMGLVQTGVSVAALAL